MVWFMYTCCAVISSLFEVLAKIVEQANASRYPPAGVAVTNLFLHPLPSVLAAICVVICPLLNFVQIDLCVG